LWPPIRERLAGLGLSFDVAITGAPGHATRLAAEAADRRIESIVSVGGDGTLHEIVNGLLARQPQGVCPVTVGVIPVGTGADFVRILGLPRTWQQACECMTSAQTRVVDAGKMVYTSRSGPAEEERYFINVAGLGFDGEVAIRANRSSKQLGGTIPYFTNLVLTLVSYANKDVDLHAGDQHLPGRMNSVIVANGGWFGGGMYIAPNARPDDGLFDVITIGDVGKLELLQTMPRVYKGTHLTHPKVQVFRTSQVHVESKQEMWIQADGEALGRAPVSFTMRAQAIRLRV
jgi:YegS/Rv2252/BmrU family lipid kinase